MCGVIVQSLLFWFSAVSYEFFTPLKMYVFMNPKVFVFLFCSMAQQASFK